MKLSDQLKDYVNAAFAGIWVHTQEPDEAVREIYKLAQEQEWGIDQWDCSRALASGGGNPGDPMLPLKALRQKPTGKTQLMLCWNYHRFVNAPLVMQELQLCVLDGKQDRRFVVVLSPVVQIPVELEKFFVVIEHELPDWKALSGIINELTDDKDQHTEENLNAALGLTRYEAEGSFALSLARHGVLQPDVIWDLKCQMLKKTDLLELYRGKEGFAQLGGLDALKDFSTRAIKHSNGVRARGLMLLGVPGTGKSAFAKALGNEVGRPTLTFDVGRCYGSLVGETEQKVRQALATADAMAPCVLFIDEIEKALSGMGGQGDSGVATRLFGTILTWLNDHTSDVFVVATSNDISKLPPEFTRAERWDAVFFLDLPNEAERKSIWRMYLHNYGICNYPEEGPQLTRLDAAMPLQLNDDNWTGAEIKACCRLAALLDTTLAEAAKNVVPVAVTAPDRVQNLREWADGRCLGASSPGVYRLQTKSTNGGRRAVKARE